MRDADVRRLRATKVSMVYQNPGAALNPSIRVGAQVAEAFEIMGAEKAEARERAQRDAQEGADLRPGPRHAPLSAPALRRHAAAGRDRDGARVRPDAPHPRRADDGARRHRRGGGARPRRRPPSGVRHERPLHQPQPRRDPEDVRARGHPLRRAAGGGRRDERRVRRARGTRTRSGSCVASPAPACARTATASTRSRATCPSSAPTCPAASSRTAAGWPRRSATRTSRRSMPSAAGTRAAATSTTRLPSCRARRRPGRPSRPRRRTAARCVKLEHASKTFRQEGQEVRALADVDLLIAPGRDARPGRGVGERQDDARPRASRADVARPGLDYRAGRQAPGAPDREAGPRAGAGAPDRLPESGFRPQPPLLRAAHHRARPDEAPRHARRQARAAAPRHRLVRALRRPALERASGAALRRPQAARRDRARLRRRSARRRLRRADLRAGRLRAGGDPQPPRRPPEPRRASPISSSRTTSASSATSPTGSRCSTSGRVMELGDAETVFSPPHHPYTEALLSAVPTVEGEERLAHQARRARFRARRTRPPDACSTRAARASRGDLRAGGAARWPRSSRATSCAATSPSRSCGSCSRRRPSELRPPRHRGLSGQTPSRRRRADGRRRPHAGGRTRRAGRRAGGGRLTSSSSSSLPSA